ncbi:Hypothetical predicted protein [Olea europaea subsp. europaea]|uniref:J domain-containing protein n=1 Tax=Olea europaea subsp. europaea TaxID=158383 RepID=A0A8S0TE58_OLEEU|nr:Hypothetical predicted protein [Olea europaea subsp. europaea]
MCCNHGVTFPRSDRFRFSFFIPSIGIRSDPLPSSISFRSRPGLAFRPLKSNNSDTISLPSDCPASFYDLLGISESGTQLEIKKAYKQLARKYHPDVSPPDRVEEHTERFIRVQEAYETLSDPRRRALYDRDMAKGLHLAFSARGHYKFDEQMEEKSEWKSRWQSQVSELKKRSTYKNSGDNNSWGARMRRQRNQSSS